MGICQEVPLSSQEIDHFRLMGIKVRSYPCQLLNEWRNQPALLRGEIKGGLTLSEIGLIEYNRCDCFILWTSRRQTYVTDCPQTLHDWSYLLRNLDFVGVLEDFLYFL